MASLDSISFADRDNIQCLFDCTGEVGRVKFVPEVIAVFVYCQASHKFISYAAVERFDAGSSRYICSADCFRLLRGNLINRARNMG